MQQILGNSMIEEQTNTRQIPYQRGSQRNHPMHHTSLHSDDESDSDEINISRRNIKRKRKKGTSSPHKDQVITVEVRSEDTLQALALRYKCNISEVKRLNKIQNDKEMYAKRYVLVPVQPFSILTETIGETISPNITFTEHKETANAEKTELTKIDISNNTDTLETEINTIILNSVYEPLLSYNNDELPDVSYVEDDQLLTSTEIDSMIDSHQTNIFKCSGDNWGLSWAQLLGFSLLLSLAGPIIYIYVYFI